MARALILAVGSDGPQVAQLTRLVADHLVADQALSEHLGPGLPAAEAPSGLPDWACYDQRLPDLIELAVPGWLAAFELPASPPALPPDQRRWAVCARQWLPCLGSHTALSHAAAPCLVPCEVRTGQQFALVTGCRVGRYDDRLTDLHALLANTRGGRVAARVAHAELTVAAQLRDELAAMIADLQARHLGVFTDSGESGSDLRL